MKSIFSFNKYLIAYLFIIPLGLSAQNKENIKLYNEFVSQTISSGASYHVYDPPFQAKPIMRSVSEAKNRYPEELMISLVSERDKAWLDHNTIGEPREKSTEYFKQKVSWDKEETYYELRSKLEFKYSGVEYAYVTFRFKTKGDDAPPLGVYLLKKEDNRWYYTKEVLSMDISFALMLFKPELLAKLFKGEKIGEDRFDQFLAKVSKNGALDLNAFAQEVMKIHADEKNETQINYFLDPLNW